MRILLIWITQQRSRLHKKTKCKYTKLQLFGTVANSHSDTIKSSQGASTMEFTYRTKKFDIQGLSQTDHIYKIISKTKSFYEIDLLEHIYNITEKSDQNKTLAIDVGANIGNHSIFLKSFICDHLIAIEPNPTILPILKRNLEKNIDSYSLYECAVGDSVGTGSLSIPDGSNDNVGMAKISYGSSGDNNIPITTLDQIINEWQNKQSDAFKISVIKIDIEGMELPALNGAEKLIKYHKPHIFAEAATEEEFEKINNFLRPLGYKKLSRWAETPVYHFSYRPSYSLLINSLATNIKKIIYKIKAKTPA